MDAEPISHMDHPHLRPDREPLIEVKDLQITFGSGKKKFVAVDDVNFTIYRGETFSLVGEDEERVAAHVGRQKKQLRETRFRIAVASRSAFADEVDVKKNTGTITAIEYEKAARAREKLRSKPPRKPRDDNSGDVVRSMFEAMGEELLRSAR